MHIVKITGKAGAGKSEVLKQLAEFYQTQVIVGSQLMAALPLLMSKTSALALNTFVDEVTPAMEPKIAALAKLYPEEYRIYLSCEDYTKQAPKHPEDILAEILKVPPGTIGNVELTLIAPSRIESGNYFCRALFDRRLTFEFLTADSRVWNNLQDSWLFGNSSLGSIHLVSWEMECGYDLNGRLARIQAMLLRGEESNNLIKAFTS